MTSSSGSDRISLMNTASSITSGVIKDAMQRSPDELNEAAVDGPRQLLPNTQQVGVRPLGNYKEYKPPALPDWRQKRAAASAQPPAPQPQVPATEELSKPKPASLDLLSSRAAVPIALGVALDRAPTVTASVSRLSLTAPAPPPRPTSTGAARGDAPTRQPIHESISPKAAKQAEAEKVDSQPEPTSQLNSALKAEALEQEGKSSAELCEAHSTSDSGCLADLLDLGAALPAIQATLVALPPVQEAPAEHVLDSSTTEALLAQRRSIKAAIEQGVVDKTLFSDVDEDGDSELHVALFSPDEYCTECELLVAGSERSELSRANNMGVTPLIAATACGAPAPLVRAVRLATAIDECERQSERVTNTAAHVAAQLGRADAIDALFTKPTDTEVRFVEQFTALGAARLAINSTTAARASPRTDLEAAWRLVERSVNARNELRETPLYVACKASSVEAARRLLQHGADPRIQEATDRRSPLHEAVLLQSLPLVRLLLDADPSFDTLHLETRNGQTALELAHGVQPATREQTETRDAIVALLERAQDCEEAIAEKQTQLQSEQTSTLDEGVTDLDFEN